MATIKNIYVLYKEEVTILFKIYDLIIFKLLFDTSDKKFI